MAWRRSVGLIGMLACVVVVLAGAALVVGRGLAPGIERPARPAASVRVPPTASASPTATASSAQVATLCSCPTSGPARPGVATPTPLPQPAPAGGAPQDAGQVIKVSVSQQWLWAYQDGQQVFATPVTTGRPELPTPLGTYQVMDKVEDVMFYSPWPPGSPFYYTPVHVDYALLFRNYGFFLHDAPWRPTFGPGTNVPHSDPDGTWDTGSHGCVEMAPAAGAWIYQWAPVGTTVEVVA